MPGCSNRRLSTADVLDIRRFVDEGWTAIPGNRAAIALAYGCSTSNVSSIAWRLVARRWVPEAADSPFYEEDNRAANH